MDNERIFWRIVFTIFLAIGIMLLLGAITALAVWGTQYVGAGVIPLGMLIVLVMWVAWETSGKLLR
jgi:hypothetical protein